MLKIIDNFLPEDIFENIEKEILGEHFPWYKTNILGTFCFEDNKDPLYNRQMTHIFYRLVTYRNDSKYLKAEIEISDDEVLSLKEGDSISYSSDYCHLIDPILKNLNLSKNIVFTRIKANLNMYSPEPIEGGYHTDFETPRPSAKTALYYFNTNNGGTKFITGQFVQAVRNRLVVFPQSLEHMGIGPTDSHFKSVLNINWENPASPLDKGHPHPL